MNAKAIAWGLILLSFLWPYLAFQSYVRGKTGICLLQSAVGVAFFIRGVVEMRKANRM